MKDSNRDFIENFSVGKQQEVFFNRIAKWLQEHLLSTSNGYAHCPGLREATQREEKSTVLRTLKSRLYEENIYNQRPAKIKIGRKNEEREMEWTRQDSQLMPTLCNYFKYHASDVWQKQLQPL